MKRKLILISSIIINIILLLVAYNVGYTSGELAKETRLAQTLCKYAEYDFCKVQTYQIKIKKSLEK